MEREMNIPSILKSTKPILYETGYDEWPYAYAGSCFPIRWKKTLYIVSAYHCFENHQINPEDTLYPIPTDQSSFFGFCQKLRVKIDEATDLKHYDQILLQVSTEIHKEVHLESVESLDLSCEQAIISLSNTNIKDVWLRGYLFDNPDHEIDFEKSKIRQQAYMTNGIVSTRKSFYNYCHMLKVKTSTPENFSPNGMSGSPVYAEDTQGNIRFAGTVIEYNKFTDEFLVIDSSIIRELLRREHV
jgi:hypothetical protein